MILPCPSTFKLMALALILIRYLKTSSHSKERKNTHISLQLRTLACPPGFCLDIAFTIDTTGSMGDDIAEVKSYATYLIQKLHSYSMSLIFDEC